MDSLGMYMGGSSGDESEDGVAYVPHEYEYDSDSAAVAVTSPTAVPSSYDSHGDLKRSMSIGNMLMHSGSSIGDADDDDDDDDDGDGGGSAVATSTRSGAAEAHRKHTAMHSVAVMHPPSLNHINLRDDTYVPHDMMHSSSAPSGSVSVSTSLIDSSTATAGADADTAETDGESIRVLCRFRPVNDQELQASGGSAADTITHYQSHDQVRVTVDAQPHEFTFHRVLQPEATQEQLYECGPAGIIADVMNGYNGAILCYGQTGSGKTYTMQGPGFEDARQLNVNLAESQRGVIPRCMEDMFRLAESAPDHVRYTIKASFLEIYMEKMRDLLRPTVHAPTLKRRLERMTAAERLDYTRRTTIRIVNPAMNTDNLTVTNVLLEQIRNVDDVKRLMVLGARNRVTAATAANDESSRSHAIFLVSIARRDLLKATTKRSQFYLVDLAGSESVSKTQAVNTRLKEAQMINKSLLALGQVIFALCTGTAKYIPYRDSKLTRLLKNSFGGNSKTLLIINCSPHSYNARETLSTLRFGDRTKAIKNKPMENTQHNVPELLALLRRKEALLTDRDKLIFSLQRELDYMKRLLHTGSGGGVTTAVSVAVGDGETTAIAAAAAVAPGGDIKGKARVILAASQPDDDAITNGGAGGGGGKATTAAVLVEQPKSLERTAVVRIAEPPVSPIVRSATTAVSPAAATVAAPTAVPTVYERYRRKFRGGLFDSVNRRFEFMFLEDLQVFKCPLTGMVMKDPVLCADTFTYERAAIEQWLLHHDRSPISNATLPHTQLTANYALRRQIAARFANVQFGPGIFVSPFDLLPVELLERIVSFLPSRVILRLSRVSQLWYAVCMSDHIWRIKIDEYFPITAKHEAARRTMELKRIDEGRREGYLRVYQRLHDERFGVRGKGSLDTRRGERLKVHLNLIHK